MADTFIIECRHGVVWYAQILTKPRLIDIESMRSGDVARIVTLDQVDVRLCMECEENNDE